MFLILLLLLVLLILYWSCVIFLFHSILIFSDAAHSIWNETKNLITHMHTNLKYVLSFFFLFFFSFFFSKINKSKCVDLLIQFIYLGFIPPFPKCIHFNNIVDVKSYSIHKICWTFSPIYRLFVVAVAIIYCLLLLYIHWEGWLCNCLQIESFSLFSSTFTNS